jgi:hypothetical protein
MVVESDLVGGQDRNSRDLLVGVVTIDEAQMPGRFRRIPRAQKNQAAAP